MKGNKGSLEGGTAQTQAQQLHEPGLRRGRARAHPSSVTTVPLKIQELPPKSSRGPSGSPAG